MSVNNASETDLIAQLSQITGDAKQLEIILNRVLQAMAAEGFQLQVDVAAIAKTLHQRLDKVEKDTKQIVADKDRLEELQRTFQLLTSSLELDAVLNEVIDTVIRLTGAERAYLVLRDKKTGELKTVARRNWERETLSETDAVFSRSIVMRALTEAKAIITTNAQSDDRFQNVQSVVNNQLRSILCIPLILHGQAVGVLYADNRITQNIFRQEEVPTLTSFGKQAAIAIENARQYGQVKDDLNKALSELQSLQIQIDRVKLERQVSQITDTDFFEKLSTQARSMRRRFDKDNPSGEDEQE